jgi:hypothetical protein
MNAQIANKAIASDFSAKAAGLSSGGRQRINF